eukprot:gene16703-biopygen11322
MFVPKLESTHGSRGWDLLTMLWRDPQPIVRLSQNMTWHFAGSFFGCAPSHQLPPQRCQTLRRGAMVACTVRQRKVLLPLISMPDNVNMERSSCRLGAHSACCRRTNGRGPQWPGWPGSAGQAGSARVGPGRVQPDRVEKGRVRAGRVGSRRSCSVRFGSVRV